MKSVIGITPPKQGTIRYKGEEITGKDPYLLARKGISYVPDDRRIFADLTVGENLEIAEKKAKSGEEWNRERVYGLFPALKEIENRRGGCLSGGGQKRLGMSRALRGNL